MIRMMHSFSTAKAKPVAEAFVRNLDSLLRDVSPSGVNAVRYSDELLKHLTARVPLAVVSFYSNSSKMLTTYQLVAGVLDRVSIDRMLKEEGVPSPTQINLGFDTAYNVVFTPNVEEAKALSSDFGSKDPVLSRVKAGMNYLRADRFTMPTYAEVKGSTIVMRQSSENPALDTDNTLYMLQMDSFSELTRQLRKAGISQSAFS